MPLQNKVWLCLVVFFVHKQPLRSIYRSCEPLFPCVNTDEPCTYLDMRSYIGHDVCEYPDSDKVILMPGGETFCRSEQHPYFDGETDTDKIWEELQ